MRERLKLAWLAATIEMLEAQGFNKVLTVYVPEDSARRDVSAWLTVLVDNAIWQFFWAGMQVGYAAGFASGATVAAAMVML